MLDHGANPEARTEEGETVRFSSNILSFLRYSMVIATDIHWQVMDLVEEDDLEEMAVIFGSKEEVGRGGEKRDVGIGETGIENRRSATPCVKMGGEGLRPELNVELAKKVTKSLEVTECNVGSKNGQKDDKSSEGEVVVVEMEGRGKKMPAWVRRESVQWENSQREMFSLVQESSVKEEKKDLTCKEDAEGEVKSRNDSLKSESCKEERESGEVKSEESEGAVKKGQREVTVATGLVWKEEEKEEFDFCKVEEKLSEWRRRRKSGREEKGDDRVR